MEHAIKKGESLSAIAKKYNITLNKLLSANPQYKSNPDSISVGDQLLIPNGTTSSTTSTAKKDHFKVEAGQLTFDAEGLETPGKYFSRKPHVPGTTSGITIGRGYDMKERSSEEIIEDLTAAGVSLAKAKKFSRCHGLKGAKARQFLEDNNYTDLSINPAQQNRLFTLTYNELAGDVLRICNKADVVAKYGKTDWTQLEALIKDVVVDLRYRGDYTGATRQRVQPTLVDNDLSALANLMADKNYWVGTFNVPTDRFKRRRDYLINKST